VGFFDKLKQQATEVASTVAEKTQETARIGQLHAQLRGLRGEEKDALTEFGRSAHALHESGELAARSGELDSGAARIADVRRQITAKEAEIAEVRGADGASTGETFEASAEEVPDPTPADPPAAEPPPE
jgi:cell division protein FtsB